MTADEALDVLIEAITCEALQEMLDNGLLTSYLELGIGDATSAALRLRVEQRIATGPRQRDIELAAVTADRG